MFCPNCGTQLPDAGNVKTCSNCGMSLETSERPVSPHPTQNSPAQQAAGNSFIDKAVANYVQSSLVLALVGFISTFMTWITFGRSEFGRGVMSYLGIDSKLNAYKYISIQDEPQGAFLLLFALPIIGLILAVISYKNKNEKLGKSGVLVMGIGGIITYLFLSSYASDVNKETYANLMNLGIGTKIWLIASILQIVLFILIKKRQAR